MTRSALKNSSTKSWLQHYHAVTRLHHQRAIQLEASSDDIYEPAEPIGDNPLALESLFARNGCLVFVKHPSCPNRFTLYMDDLTEPTSTVCHHSPSTYCAPRPGNDLQPEFLDHEFHVRPLVYRSVLNGMWPSSIQAVDGEYIHQIASAAARITVDSLINTLDGFDMKPLVTPIYPKNKGTIRKRQNHLVTNEWHQALPIVRNPPWIGFRL